MLWLNWSMWILIRWKLCYQINILINYSEIDWLVIWDIVILIMGHCTILCHCHWEAWTLSTFIFWVFFIIIIIFIKGVLRDYQVRFHSFEFFYFFIFFKWVQFNLKLWSFHLLLFLFLLIFSLVWLRSISLIWLWNLSLVR